MNNPRINNPLEINSSEVRSIIEAGRVPTIQFSKPGYTPELLQDLNRLCIELGNRIEVRFYGHDGDHFDAAVLADLPDVRWLSVDCLTAIVNECRIGELPLLERLSFGVFRFDDAGFLGRIGVEKLTQLTLVGNAKRNLDLAPLGGCRHLKTLFVQGHTRNVEVVSCLPQLTSVGLSGFPKNKALRFLGAIDQLRSLTLILGERAALDEFSHAALERLSIIRVRGLESIGSLHRFPRLRRLEVQDQLQIRALNLAGARLQEITMTNCKNLAQLNGIERMNELAKLRISRTSLDLDALMERDWPASLRTLALHSDSRTWNDAARATLDQRGYRAF